MASQVNSDFDTVYGWINNNAIWTDGSRAFTAVPTGPSADPTSANQLARKSYVDAHVNNQQIPGLSGGILKYGSGTISFNGVGLANIVFSAAFPNACQGVSVAILGAVPTREVQVDAMAANAATIYMYDPATGAPVINVNQAVVWIACGF